MEKVSVRFADDKGRIREAVFETPSIRELEKGLTERGYFLLSTEVLEKTLWERFSSVLPIGRGVSTRELLDFTKLLRTLLKAGLPLKDALDLLQEDSGETPLSHAVSTVVSDIQEGISFSKALSRHPEVFPEIYVRTVVAGERAGALEAVLGRLCQYFANLMAIRAKLIGALIYPVILLGVSAAAVTYMLLRVVPEFVDLFKALDVPLPIYTKLLLWFSGFLSSWWPVFLLVFATGVYAYRRFVETREGRLAVDGVKLRIPLIGDLEGKFALSQFSRTLSTMIGGGIPLMEGLTVVLESLENKALAERLSRLPKEIEQGDSFARALKEVPGIPKMMTRVVHVGEESGNLGEMLSNLADHFDEEISNLTSMITALVEPALFLMMATVVGAFVICLLVPILTAATQIH